MPMLSLSTDAGGGAAHTLASLGLSQQVLRFVVGRLIVEFVQSLKELQRGHDLNTFVATQVQEIMVLGDQVLRASGYCTSQHHIVLGIALHDRQLRKIAEHRFARSCHGVEKRFDFRVGVLVALSNAMIGKRNMSHFVENGFCSPEGVLAPAALECLGVDPAAPQSRRKAATKTLESSTALGLGMAHRMVSPDGARVKELSEMHNHSLFSVCHVFVTLGLYTV